ncbi:MAG: hypothetical protein KDA80_07870 [Planctomycetaceae bacterium]|nr:hypothetical protein [Planctomycetaceae bacterium]
MQVDRHLSNDSLDTSEANRETGPWQRLLTGDLPLESESLLFIMVNFLDFVVTYRLLALGRFRESNPIAEYFLYRWGPFKGMMLFKISLVVFVILVTQVIAMKRLETARLLLMGGSLAVIGVVVYSVRLFLQFG